MKNLKYFVLLFAVACSNQNQSSNGTSVYSSLSIDPSATNVMQVAVGKGICDNVDEPCTTVTICKGSTCVSINDVLIDTGSTGLRLFNTSAIQNLGLTPVNAPNGHPLAECFGFLDGTADWGPVVKADVVLGGQTAPQIPIQIIDASYGHLPSNCRNPDSSPTDAHFNGILGVSNFIQDCGTSCSTNSSNNIYYACTTSSCTASNSPLAMQVVNPGSALPSPYNDGVILSLPSLGTSTSNSQLGIQGGMAGAAYGYLIFGIQSSVDVPAEIKRFAVDSSGNFHTTFFGKDYAGSFIDSGSNGLYFPNGDANIPVNASNQFFDPNGILSESATQTSLATSPSISNVISFQIIGASAAFAAGSPNRAFNNIGAPLSSRFDWGLPFFFGRNVRVGFETASTYGFWSY